MVLPFWLPVLIGLASGYAGGELLRQFRDAVGGIFELVEDGIGDVAGRVLIQQADECRQVLCCRVRDALLVERLDVVP